MKHYKTTSGKERPTIGFLIDWVGGRYQSQVWPGAVAAAEERDANLIIFSGRSLRAPQGYLSQSNAIYDVISNENIDGLVILSGTISDYVSRDEFRSFVDRFHPVPIVSISIELENIPSVLIDNRTGMRAIVSHFIEVHGHQRIAFICGPEVNDEAVQRFATYQDELARHGIPFDPMLVAPGNFSEAAGINAVRLFLDERHIMPDAIIGVDDDTAIGVLSELRSRGLLVPGDIAVAGFDNIDEAKYTLPPLTTVTQPFFAQSHLAVSMLLDYLDGKSIPQKELLTTEIVVRQSCGCIPETVRLAGAVVNKLNDRQQNEMLIEQVIEDVRNAIELNIFEHRRIDKAGEWATKLVHSFFSDMDENDTNNFITTLVQLLQMEIIQKTEIGKWQNIVSTMRVALQSQSPERVNNSRAEGLWGQARVLIGEAMERIKGDQLLKFRNHSLIESEVDRSLLTTLELEELKSIVAETLPPLGITSGYIIMSDAERYNPARMLLGFNETGILTDGDSVEYNPLVDIVPLNLLPQSRRYTMVMEALYFQTEHLGFALLEMNPLLDGIIYSELHQQLSSALKGALLLLEYKKAELKTQSINKELESFSYSVSHDLKAPLRAISQISTWLVEDYAEVIDAEGQEKLKLLTNRTQYLHNLIDGILQYSKIGRMTETIVNIDTNILVRDIIGILDPPSIQFAIENTLPVVRGVRTHVAAVFQNLLSNAINYIDKPQGMVKITCTSEPGYWIFSVADNGPGIEKKYHEKIFQMFQTLSSHKDVNSTGIGLALVKRIVEQWGGVVWVESEAGQGSTFFFTIPQS